MAVKKTSSVNPLIWSVLSLARIVLGLIFLWVFVDKLFGLGYPTSSDGALINGGSPTLSFLSDSEGPFAALFNAMAGSWIVDFLFMAGLLGIGVAMTLGVAVRLGAVTGAVFMLLVWMASFPLENNPVLDQHVVYLLLFVILALTLPEQRLSLQKKWRKLPTVKRSAWLW